MNDTAIRAAAQAVHDWIFSPPDLAPIRGEPSIMQIEAIIKSHDTPAGDLVSREEAVKACEVVMIDMGPSGCSYYKTHGVFNDGVKAALTAIRALPTVTPAPAAVWDEASEIVKTANAQYKNQSSLREAILDRFEIAKANYQPAVSPTDAIKIVEGVRDEWEANHNYRSLAVAANVILTALQRAGERK